MANPLSLCCGKRAPETAPQQKSATTSVVSTAPTVTPAPSTAALIDANGQAIVREADTVAKASSTGTPQDSSIVASASQPAPGFLKRLSTHLSTLTSTGTKGKADSVEQGLQHFDVPLSAEDRRVLLESEIPSKEIENLSIGVDAGGMGIIHRAEWKGIQVAIKEASAHVIAKEVEIYRRVKGCEGVVEFLGVTCPKELDKVCIVTRYAEQGSLAWYLKTEYQNLTWNDKLRLASQITSSIERLHQEGIFHRDLHGGNILISAEGNALLTDFGASTIMEERMVRNIDLYGIKETVVPDQGSKFISKTIELPTSSDSSKPKTALEQETRGDPLIGVMAYIAPERFRDPKFFDAKCDIYSLGVLLWELTTGHSAFAKVPQDVHLAVAILNGKRELSVEDTPVEYRELYERCWDTDPAKRPGTSEISKTLAKIRSSMTPEQLAAARTRNNTQFDSFELYQDSLSIPRPTSDIQQYLMSE
ncbi:hypothetical protein BGW38_001026 [Lunasporangiospora selenospora]|uniref:Protein kinase domain-containing protein n=1 Tax=Lunasporangiospora selenospora TaxID=979761 RepID=A0A9P6KI40_9FUNG|nr:hypothetical protein BGW38_001026 [Lunasporangiospora selenospora]